MARNVNITNTAGADNMTTAMMLLMNMMERRRDRGMESQRIANEAAYQKSLGSAALQQAAAAQKHADNNSILVGVQKQAAEAQMRILDETMRQGKELHPLRVKAAQLDNDLRGLDLEGRKKLMEQTERDLADKVGAKNFEAIYATLKKAGSEERNQVAALFETERVKDMAVMAERLKQIQPVAEAVRGGVVNSLPFYMGQAFADLAKANPEATPTRQQVSELALTNLMNAKLGPMKGMFSGLDSIVSSSAGPVASDKLNRLLLNAGKGEEGVKALKEAIAKGEVPSMDHAALLSFERMLQGSAVDVAAILEDAQIGNEGGKGFLTRAGDEFKNGFNARMSEMTDKGIGGADDATYKMTQFAERFGQHGEGQAGLGKALFDAAHSTLMASRGRVMSLPTFTPALSTLDLSQGDIVAKGMKLTRSNPLWAQMTTRMLQNGAAARAKARANPDSPYAQQAYAPYQVFSDEDLDLIENLTGVGVSPVDFLSKTPKGQATMGRVFDMAGPNVETMRQEAAGKVQSGRQAALEQFFPVTPNVPWRATPNAASTPTPAAAPAATPKPQASGTPMPPSFGGGTDFLQKADAMAGALGMGLESENR